jgi:hypothetical protein
LSNEIPLLVAVVIGLGPSVVAVVALVAADLRDRRQIQHEREMRLRDERMSAYRKLLAATVTAHVDREGHEALATAYAEVSLLASTDEINVAAREVWVGYGLTYRVSAKAEEEGKERGADFAQALSRARLARDRFLALAHAELGVEGRSREDLREIEGYTPGEGLPYPEYPEKPSSQR